MNIDFTYVGKHYAPRTHDKMKEVLMDPNGQGPVNHYYMIRGGINQKNITVWEPGTISGEYIKTYGHYHVGDLSETYTILFGNGIGIIQKRAVDNKGNPIDDVIEEFKAVPVKTGDTVFMESGYGHAFANIGSTYMVTADDTPVNFDEKNAVSMPGHADYLPMQKLQGFAYYVVEQNGKPALKKNPKYKEVRKTEFHGIPVIEDSAS